MFKISSLYLSRFPVTLAFAFWPLFDADTRKYNILLLVS